jgi:hypothetical protein
MTKLGKVAYDAYFNQLASEQTMKIPSWENLGKTLNEAWDLSAHAVFKEVAGWYENYKKD